MSFEIVVVGEFVNDLLYLLELKSTHKAQCATLKGDDWWCLLWELLRCI